MVFLIFSLVMKGLANIVILSMVRQEMLMLNLLYLKEILISISLDAKLIEPPISKIFHFIRLHFISSYIIPQ